MRLFDMDSREDYLLDGKYKVATPSAEPIVIRSKTLMPTKDFKEWAKRIREVNPNAVVIPCDAEVASADAEWIPCSERLPDIDTSVIICTASGTITDGYRWNEKDWFLAWGEYNGWHEGNDVGRITAWMPLPKPYKGGDSDDKGR